MNNKIKYILLFFGLLFLDIFYSYIIAGLLSVFGINIENFSEPLKSISLVIIDLSLILIVYFIFRKELEKEFKLYKENFIKMLTFAILFWGIGLVLMAITNTLIIMIYPSQAINEETVRETLQKAPIYASFGACIFAPFMEEIIFRKIVHKVFTNKILFIIVSGLLFGLVHNLHGLGTMQMLYIIPYGLFGSVFAYMYVKTKNIFVPMTAHFIHNTILIVFSLISSGVL